VFALVVRGGRVLHVPAVTGANLTSVIGKNGFFAILKHGIAGVYHGVPETYLQLYLANFRTAIPIAKPSALTMLSAPPSHSRDSRASGSPLKQLEAEGGRKKPRNMT
jgi:hypothetical protein